MLYDFSKLGLRNHKTRVFPFLSCFVIKIMSTFMLLRKPAPAAVGKSISEIKPAIGIGGIDFLGNWCLTRPMLAAY